MHHPFPAPHFGRVLLLNSSQKVCQADLKDSHLKHLFVKMFPSVFKHSAECLGVGHRAIAMMFLTAGFMCDLTLIFFMLISSPV